MGGVAGRGGGRCGRQARAWRGRGWRRRQQRGQQRAGCLAGEKRGCRLCGLCRRTAGAWEGGVDRGAGGTGRGKEMEGMEESREGRVSGEDTGVQ